MIGFPAARAGLDLGTANTLLYVKGRGVAIREPSLVTVRTSTGAIEAVGGDAQAGLGRTPRDLHTERPVRAGIVANLNLIEGMLRLFLSKARIAGPLRRFKLAIAIPEGLTEVERQAVIELSRHAGAADSMLTSQALAAAQGAALPIEEPRGRMVVNIGAGLTEIALVSLATTVHSRVVRMAGNDMDAAIAAHVRATHQLIIGERTAEQLKIAIGSAMPCDGEPTLRIKGRCLTRGIPREVTIRAAEIRDALSPTIQRILKAIREALEESPPELAADLIETGIVLTGGSALLRGLDRRIAADCGLPVTVAPDPLSCVIRGLARQLE